MLLLFVSSFFFTLLGISCERFCIKDEDCLSKTNVTLICSTPRMCISHPLHLGDPCAANSHCYDVDQNSECVNDSCECKENFDVSDMGHCVERKTVLPAGFIALCVVIPLAITIGIGFIIANRKSCSTSTRRKSEPEAVIACAPSAPISSRRPSRIVRPAPPPPPVDVVSRVTYSQSQGVVIQGAA